MFSTDPYVALDLNRQRVQRLRDEAAADTLAHRVRRRGGQHRGPWWVASRRRAPAIP